MKISNNALNFLLAQYRAIFKRAYVKGLAAAVMLTAGLAAGQAQAARLSDPANLPATDDSIIIGGTDVPLIQIQSGTSSAWHGTVTIQSGDADLNANFIAGNNLTNLSGRGTLTINTNDSAKYKTEGLMIAGNSANAGSGDVTLSLEEINVLHGTLNLDDGNSSKSGTISVAADRITIGGAASSTTGATAYLSLTSEVSTESVTLGRADKEGLADSVITVNNGGVLTMNSSGSNSGTFILGESFTVGNGGQFVVADGAKNTVSTDDFAWESGSFNVVKAGQATGTLTFAGTTGTVANGANVLVESGASWILANQGKPATQDSAAIAANVTFESGANVQIGGTLNISGGKLTVADGAGLHAITAAGTGTSGSIVVSNSGTATGTLSISAADLKAFLNGTNKHQTISESDGQYSLAEGDPVADSSGSLILSSGNLFLTGTSASTPFDLATKLKFSGASAATTGAAGIIVVNKSSISTVYGDNLAVSKQLGDGSNNLTGASSNLFIKANTLTLGAANTASPSDLGFSGATTHNLTVLSNDDGGFKLVNDITLHATDHDVTRDVTLGDDYIETAEDGTIKGNLNVSGATLTVDAGRYKTEDDLTISSGSLAISGTSGDADGSYYPNALDASLTVINGDFEITNNTNDTNSSVTITGASGATAFLDLRQAASVTWGSGTVTVSGATAQRTADGEELGQGILYLNGTQFGNFLDESAKTKLKLEDDGVLYVEGTTTSLSPSIDVTDFGTAADAAGKVAFTGAGTFETDVGLTLNVAADASDAGDKVLAIGKGTIKAPSITLKNNLKDAKDFTISGGTLEIASNLDSNVNTVIFKDDSTSGRV